MTASSFSFPEVRVVEASAGAGKTYALASRYLQLLFHPQLAGQAVPTRNILAITFTNKAAFEMKARILEFLKRIALDQFPASEREQILRRLNVDEARARQQAFAVMEGLIRHYNFFQVQTIDSFINALLVGCAFKIRLSAKFRIKTNAPDYLEYSLDQLVDRAQSDPDLQKTFRAFLHHYLYLENRLGWFPKKDILVIVGDLFRKSNLYGSPFTDSGYLPSEVGKMKRAVLERIKALWDQLPEGTNAAFLKSLDKMLEGSPVSFDVDSLSDFFLREEVPARKGALIPSALARDWERLRKDLRHLCEHEAYSLFVPYVDIFGRVLEIFKDVSAQDDVLFLEELNKKAGLLFDEDYVTVEELYYRLAARFRHYLIDEFQDTSRLQWHNLEKMVEEALSTGGSLFYVGDRKQAIYRFRGGEVELFDAVKERFGAFNVTTEALAKNWRSQKAIVEFNNRVFSWDNLQRFIADKEAEDREKGKKAAVVFGSEDLSAVREVFSASQQDFCPDKAGGYVSIEAVDHEKKEDRDEAVRQKVVALVAELGGRFALKDIAVLTRSNQDVEMVTNWLLAEGVAVDSERTASVKAHPLIEELVDFLAFLNSPIDNRAFSRFLQGEIFTAVGGLDPELLREFVFARRGRLREESDFYLYTDFREEFPQEWERFLDEFFRHVGLYPLYEMVVSIYNRFDVLRLFPEAQGFFMRFLEMVRCREDEHSDLASFLDYYETVEGEDLFVRVADTDAVKVTTVHKAKGLEFPVVVLPFLGMEVQVSASGPDQPQSYVLEHKSEGINLVRLKQKYYGHSPALFELYAREYKKAFLSELNNVYVGLTRPRYELYAFVPKKIGQQLNLARGLFGELPVTVGEKKEYPRPAGEKKTLLPLPPAVYHDWFGYLREEFLSPEDLVSRRARALGEVKHFWLSAVGNLAGAEVEKILAAADERVRKAYPREPRIDEIVQDLRKLLMKKDLRDMFFVKSGEVFCEAEVVTSTGHTRRLDRLIVREREVVVVDYKSSAEGTAAQQDQVREYLRLVAPLYPGRGVKGCLLYLDEARVEEVAL